MLSKNWRIPKSEFQHILSKGKRYNSPLFLLYIVENKDHSSNNSRFAFSVPKTVAKTAVQRNRLRRLGYSVVQSHKDDVAKGYLVFFLYKKHKQILDFDLIESEIQELLSVSGMIS